jgi:hypothetical protein
VRRHVARYAENRRLLLAWLPRLGIDRLARRTGRSSAGAPAEISEALMRLEGWLG